MSLLPRRLFGLRPAPRPRRRRRPAPVAPAVERLEARAMLSAGDNLWWKSPDLVPAEDDTFYDVAVQPDGKIVAVGSARGAEYDFLVARFTAAGALDLSFGGGDGWMTYDFGPARFDSARGVALQADGRIVVGGTTTVSFGEFGLIRLERDGTRDMTYGPSGGRVIEGGGPNVSHYMNDLALAADGGVFAAGDRYLSGAASATGLLYKFTSAGLKDNGFNGVGYRELTSSNSLTAVAVDAAGRVVTVSRAGQVARLTTAGAYDNAFSGDGVMQIGYDVGTNTEAWAVATMADGRIIVAGYSTVTYLAAGVARLNADGSYDTSFDGNGRYSFSPIPTSISLRDLAVLPTGGVVVAGYTGSEGDDYLLAVLTPAGVLDGGFDTDGFLTYDIRGGDVGFGLAVTPAGHYVVAGKSGLISEDDQSSIAQFEGRLPRRDDLLGWTNSGQWWTAASTGTAFTTAYHGAWDAGLGWKYVSSGDFNRDGLSDVAGRDGNGRWWVGLNTGAAFATGLWSTWSEGAGWRDERFADFNGDGRTDVAGRAAGGQWWVMLATPAGTGFTAPALWASWSEPAGWPSVVTADFDGDGRTDIAGRANNGQWWVARSTGAAFVTSNWGYWSGATWNDVLAGDFDGDGRSDLAGRNAGGQWWVARSTGSAFTNLLYTTWSDAGWRDVRVGDFNRDGRADIAGRTSAGQWWVAVTNSAGTASTNRPFDTWSPSAGWRDVVIGDFDGNGIADIAGRTSTGQWWVSRVGFEVSLWATWSEPAGWKTFRDEFKPTLA